VFSKLFSKRLGNKVRLSRMKKLITVILLWAMSQPLFAQMFVEAGATIQQLSITRNESPGLSSVAELIKMSGGDPNSTIPKMISSRIIAPKISIGYRLPFEDFNVLVSVGTSQDWSNSFRLRGSAAVGGKTYPYPESFSARVRAYKTTAKGLSFGGEFCFDNQTSETILNNSNLTPTVRGLLNQISKDINLLGNGVTRSMQLNGIIGWQKTKDQFEFGVFGLVGLVGSGFGFQGDFKVRYYFGER
jgi:hypothetical protein